MNYLTYIYIIGAAQGVILALALLLKKVNVRSNRVLAVWLLCLAFDITVKVLYSKDQITALLPAYTLVKFFPFLYGSFYYLYIRSIAVKQPLRWGDVIHFSGFLIMAGINWRWIVNPWVHGATGFAHFDLLLYLYSVTYVLAGLLTIRRYRRTLEQQQSNTDGISLLWIDVMAYFQVLIWFIAVSQWLLPIPGYNVSIIYMAVAIWMTVMGYLALMQQNIKPLKVITAPTEVEDGRFPDVDAKLQQLMQQQRLYLEPSLSIAQLAKKSGYPEYLVSLVINQVYQQTFREYINQLRIKAAASMLQDPANQQSILDIAYACGFTSKSTFNSAFKRILNMTPSQFKSELPSSGSAVDGPG